MKRINLRVLKLKAQMLVLTMCFLFRKHVGMFFVEVRYRMSMYWINVKYKCINLYNKNKKSIVDTFKFVVGAPKLVGGQLKVYFGTDTSGREEFDVFSKKGTLSNSWIKPGIRLSEVSKDRIVRFYQETKGIENIFDYLNEKGVELYTLDNEKEYKVLTHFDGAYIPSRNRIVAKYANAELVVHEIMHAIQKHEQHAFGRLDVFRNFRAAVFMKVYQDFSYYYELSFEVEAYDIQNKYHKFVRKDMRSRRGDE